MYNCRRAGRAARVAARAGHFDGVWQRASGQATGKPFASCFYSSSAAARQPATADRTAGNLSELKTELRIAEERVASLKQAIVSHRDPSKKKSILVLGAGRSSSFLINYLLKHTAQERWAVKVGDEDEKAARAKVGDHPDGTAFRFNINDVRQREDEIKRADVVVSLLPAFMHPTVAAECVKQGRDMVTASYAASLMPYDEEAKKAGVTILMECGLDPGLDHMSAMEVIDGIKREGGQLKAFRSYTGGLVAPESDDNPWGYKFSWNPRNVVVAGQGVCQYLQSGEYKYVPYHQLFRRLEQIYVPGYGTFEGYPNRDSLSYRTVYGIQDCPTILRGTLRKPGYCSAWNVFVQLGMTDDTYQIQNADSLTYRDFLNSFLPYRPHDTVELKLAHYLGLDVNSPEMQKIKWLGMFDEQKISLKSATPAQIMQHILEKKWVLKDGDKDMIVMQHHFVYSTKQGELKETKSSLVVKGDGTETGTAMAKTVGLPLAIATRMVATGQTKDKTGVHVPTRPELYQPMLRELEKDFGITFNHQHCTIQTM